MVQKCNDEFKSEQVNDFLIPPQRFQPLVDGMGCKLSALADDFQCLAHSLYLHGGNR